MTATLTMPAKNVSRLPRRFSASAILPMLRWVVGLTFLAAAVPKILDPAGFALSLSHYALLPDSAVSAVAIVLPWIEFVAAVSLIVLPSFREASAALILTLLLIFSVALACELGRGNVACGCFGNIRFLNNPRIGLARNMLLLVAAAIVFLKDAPRSRMDHLTRASNHLGG
jgi:putative oxidoreductase